MIVIGCSVSDVSRATAECNTPLLSSLDNILLCIAFACVIWHRWVGQKILMNLNLNFTDECLFCHLMLSVASIHCIHNYSLMPKFTLLIPYLEQTTWRWQNKLDSLFKIHIPIWFFAHHLLMMCTDSQCIMFFGVGGAMDWQETPTLLGGDRGPCFYTKGNAFNCNSVTSLKAFGPQHILFSTISLIMVWMKGSVGLALI